MPKKILDKITYYFALIVIVFIPFQTPIQNFLEKRLSPSLSFWLTHFYEPVIIFLLIFAIISNVARKDFSNWKAKIPPILLVFLGLASVFFIATGFSRGLQGFRFDFIGVLFFLICSVALMQKAEKKTLISAYIFVALIASVWAIIERFLPLNYWQLLGVPSFGWGTFTVVSVYQSSAFLPGPNQLGSYLLPAVFLLILNKPEFFKEGILSKITRAVGSILLISAIVLTFSRAALVGLILGVVAYIIFIEKSRKRQALYAVILLAVVAIMASYYLSGGREARDLFTHGSSQAEHETALSSSLTEIGRRFSEPFKLTFGSGIGDAGPAALKYADGFISESWYIQLLLELGIIGLALWLYFIFVTLIRLYRDKNAGLFLGLISVSGVAIFLHTWADNPAVAITIFILIGSYLYENSN
ncbi:MAG: O-antigen ligase family protein [Patescibacteria group bacterium]